MTKDAVIVLRGVLDWAKIVGKARPYTGNPKYDKGPYWSVDLTPDAASRELLKKYGLTKKLREPNPEYEKEHRTETFLSLKVQENRADGDKNDPPTIKDVAGKNWDGRLIGNGTMADVKVKVKDYGSGSEKGVYLQAVRVLKLVPYESAEFAPLSEDDEFFAAGTTEDEVDSEDVNSTVSMEADDDTDDEIPF